MYLHRNSSLVMSWARSPIDAAMRQACLSSSFARVMRLLRRVVMTVF